MLHQKFKLSGYQGFGASFFGWGFTASKGRSAFLDNAQKAGVITTAEHKTLQEGGKTPSKVIAVDSFPQTLPKPKPQP